MESGRAGSSFFGSCANSHEERKVACGSQESWWPLPWFIVMLASYSDSTFNAVKTSFSRIALIKILLLFIIILCFMSYLVALSGIPTINHFDTFFSYHKIKVCIFYGVMNTHETIPIKSINSDLPLLHNNLSHLSHGGWESMSRICKIACRAALAAPPHSCSSPGDSCNGDENRTASKNNHFPARASIENKGDVWEICPVLSFVASMPGLHDVM